MANLAPQVGSEPSARDNGGVSTQGDPPAPPKHRRVDKATALASVLIGVFLAVIVVGFRSAVTGDDQMRLPEAIVAIEPGDGHRVLRQTRIFVDFAAGYQGVLFVNGVEIPVVRIDQLTAADGTAPQPGEQVVLPPVAIYDPGNASIVFQPQRGAAVESLRQGPHDVTVLYWRVTEGRDRSQQYSWSFQVS